MLQAVPLAEEERPAFAPVVQDSPEERAATTLEALQQRLGKSTDVAMLSDHLSLLRRCTTVRRSSGVAKFSSECGWGLAGAADSAGCGFGWYLASRV